MFSNSLTLFALLTSELLAHGNDMDMNNINGLEGSDVMNFNDLISQAFGPSTNGMDQSMNGQQSSFAEFPDENDYPPEQPSQGNAGSGSIDRNAIPLICTWIDQCQSTKSSECEGIFNMCGGKSNDPFCSAINSCGRSGNIPGGDGFQQNTNPSPKWRRELHQAQV
jgi:hypothetical protein